MTTETIEAPVAPPAETPAEHRKEVEREEDEAAAKRARKPPKDGLCKRCGQTKPVNRLLLCYPCWVKVQLEKDGWREGLPHPKTCGCDTDCVIERPHN